MLEQFIDVPELISELARLSDKLKNEANVQFYTDNSLQRDPTFIDSMGLGWINVNQKNVYFSASAILWPSSTKAEILAYLSAFIVATPKAKVTIYTDSAATIDGFAKSDQFMQLSVRKREKTPNFQLWITIDYIIKVLNLTVMMVKVKAYSSDP